jgi:hypothetical protein
MVIVQTWKLNHLTPSFGFVFNDVALDYPAKIFEDARQ